jgi:hypothetical protein
LLDGVFNLLFAENIGDVNRILGSNTVHAILMDFVLDKWGLPDPHTLLLNIDKRYPVALISASWGPMFNVLRQTLSQHREQICQLFTWEDISEDERLGVMTIWLESAIRERSKFALLDPPPDEPLRILHLTDLHFGGPLPAAFGAETDQIAQNIRRHWSKPPDFIALTGDLAHRGLPRNYASAKIWINSLAQKLDSSWSPERFLIIPGNHDICWPLALSSKIEIGREVENSKLSKVAVLDGELRRFGFSPFREFVEALGVKTQWAGASQYWVNPRYRHLGVIFFGYNSCEQLDEWGKPTQEICDETFSNLMKEIRYYRSDFPHAIPVGLMHHPISSRKKDESIINSDLIFSHFSDFRNLTMIVGHTHSSQTEICCSNPSTLQIVGPTVTQPSASRPEDTLRGFNLITLGREKGVIGKIYVDTYVYERNTPPNSRRLTFRIEDGWMLAVRDNQ